MIEKMEEEDFPVSKTALTNRYNGRLHRKTRMRTDYSHQKRYRQHDDDRMTITRKQKWEKKNNSKAALND